MPRDMEFGLTSREKSPNREAANKHTMGNKKYLSRIDKDSKSGGADLQFSFSAPKKSSSASVLCECPSCETCTKVTKTTVIVVCSKCKKLFDVDEDTTISE